MSREKECSLNIGQVYLERELPESCLNCLSYALEGTPAVLNEETSYDPSVVQRYGEEIITSTLEDNEFGDYLESDRSRTLVNDEGHELAIRETTVTTYSIEGVEDGVTVTYSQEIGAVCLLSEIEDAEKARDEPEHCPLPLGGLY